MNILAIAGWPDSTRTCLAAVHDGLRRGIIRRCVQAVLLVAALGLTSAASAGMAPPLIVTTTMDKNDGICNADCSLREAIGTANVFAGTDTIILPSGDYVLSGVFGALDFGGNLVLDASAGNVRIDGSVLSRIVQLERGVSAEIRGARLVGRVVDFIGTGAGGQLIVSGGTVRVIGETVTGDFTYREGAGGIEITMDSATMALALKEGQPGAVGVGLSDARGAAVETGAGMAGVIAGSGSLEGAAATLGGTLEYRYNNTDSNINTTVVTPLGVIAIDVPAFVRDLAGADVTIALAGAPPLVAAMQFELTDLGGTPAIAIGVGGGAISFGSGAVTGFDASGAGLLQENGQLALSVPLTLAFPADLSFDGGSNLLEMNSSSNAVQSTYSAFGALTALSVSSGPSTRLIANSALLGISGDPAVSGDFQFEEITVGGEAAVAIGILQGQFTLGNGRINIGNFSGTGVILNSGQLALDADVALFASIPNVELVTGNARLQMNSRSGEVSDTIEAGGLPLPLELPGGPFTRIIAPLADLGLTGGPLLTADLALEEIEFGAASAVTIGISAGTLNMASGNISVARVAGIGLVLESGAFGLSASGQPAITPPALSLSGSGPGSGPGTVIINSAAPAFNATVQADGIPVLVDLPEGGPYTRLQMPGAIGLTGGPPITGGVMFEEIDVTGGTGAAVNITDGTLTLGDGAVAAAGLSGTGLLLPSGQLALSLPVGTVDFAAPGLALDGTARAELNSTDGAVNASFSYAGIEVPLLLPAGPYTRITAPGNALSAAGFGAFTGDFLIVETQSEMQALARITSENASTAPGGIPPLLNAPLNGTLLSDAGYSFAAAAVDGDGDGFASDADNCDADFNPFQTDSDGDGIGDPCDSVAVPAAGGAGLALLAFGVWLINIRLRRARQRRL